MLFRSCELTIQSPNWVKVVALSPDNKHILSGCETVHVWDSSTGQIVFGPLQVHGTVSSVVYSPNGRYFVSGSSDGSVIIWDLTTGTNHSVLIKSHSTAIHSIAFHPTSETFATASIDGTTVFWDTNTFELIHKPPATDTSTSIQYSPDGRFILRTSWNQIKVLHTQTGRPLGKSSDNGTVMMVAAFSPDGRWVASGSEQGTVKIWKFLGYHI